MDVNAITAALRDLLGPDVVLEPENRFWRWQQGPEDEGWHVYHIWDDGEVSVCANNNGPILSVEVLDKLHAASTIVRRMAGEAV